MYETLGRDRAALRNILIKDRKTGVSRAIEPPNGDSRDATISAEGRTVVFASAATNLTSSPDANGAGDDVYRFDVASGTISRVSVDASGDQPSTGSVSDTVVAFQSDASDLTCGRRCPPAMRDINPVADIFAFDRRTRVLRRISTGRRSWIEPSIGPALDGIGAVVAFSSRHPRDSGDEGDDYDLFVRLPAK